MEQIEKLDLKSMSIPEDKKALLQQLFPEVFAEGKIDFEKLKQTLGEDIDTASERFGLSWAGKSECFRIIQEPSIATLKPAKEESVNWDTTGNLFIEGDNLEVLKQLQKSYYGEVKMIFIDPPYNTGNEFIYPDNYKENLDTYLAYTGQVNEDGKKFSTNTETSGRFHSKWLNMMYPRLYLARNLLKKDGVIFIAIDDNEIHNLRSLCNEIFGEENFISEIIWQHSVQPKGYTDKFSVHHNYILCYKKSDDFTVNELERTEEHNKNYSNPDNDPNGAWRSGDVRNALYRPNLIYDITTPSGKTITPPENGWRWSKDTLQEKIDSGEIIFSEDESRIIRKIYLKNQSGRAPETIWFADEVGSTRDASSSLKDLFDNEVPFDTPKPIGLINRMMQIAGLKSGEIVLDFFAGSASTAQAVLESKYNAKFVLVQLPEPIDNAKPQGKAAEKLGLNNITDIGKERIRRVIDKIKKEQSEKKEAANGSLFKDEQGNKQELDLGFKVFKLDKSNFKIWDGSIEEEPLEKQLKMGIDHVDPNSSAEDIFYEILLKSGFGLNVPVETLEMAGKKVYSVADDALMICLDKNLNKEVIKAIAEKEPARVVCLDEGFKGNDQLKTNAVQIMKSHNVEDFKTV
ncbi:MAG: site-specific DNA-methyltransferase [Flavobacteriales bacterium]|nr:site-specific DNA-methyltransferase [Flavobacteriales bacterium]